MTSVNPIDEQDYSQRLKKRQESDLENIWQLLDQVKDPEIPVLSLWDLGVLTNIQQCENHLSITLTPTYSGCPALEVMRADIEKTLIENGYSEVIVKTRLSPAWSSHWISPQGKEKMREYGIAPPNENYCAGKNCLTESPITIACPHCFSLNTRQISEFGSTACKALHQCSDCLEPFDYFKSI